MRKPCTQVQLLWGSREDVQLGVRGPSPTPLLEVQPALAPRGLDVLGTPETAPGVDVPMVDASHWGELSRGGSRDARQHREKFGPLGW